VLVKAALGVLLGLGLPPEAEPLWDTEELEEPEWELDTVEPAGVVGVTEGPVVEGPVTDAPELLGALEPEEDGGGAAPPPMQLVEVPC